MTSTRPVPGHRSRRSRAVTRVGRLAGAAAVCATAGVAGVVGTLAVGSPAGAVDDSLGTPGFCRDDDGVTVIVDFQQLGATTIVRCAPGSQTRTGLEVLEDAGFQVEGVQRWGEGFVCRIENRPSATEPLSVPGDDEYREACVDTPPATAFWSYWRADEGGGWRYSQQGIKTSEVEPGGFEGWSFSLGTGADSAPRLAPRRPESAAEGSAGEPADGADGADRADGADGADAPSSAGPPPLPREADGESTGLSTGQAAGGDQSRSRTPATEPAWTGGDTAPDVRAATRDGSGWSSALGLGAVAAVAAVAATMSLRRRHRRAPPGPRA